MIDHVQEARKPLSAFELERMLEDGGLYDSDFRRTYSLYAMWKRSGYVCLPVAGGLLDQPRDMMHDFNVFGLIDAYFDALEEQERRARRDE